MPATPEVHAGRRGLQVLIPSRNVAVTRGPATARACRGWWLRTRSGPPGAEPADACSAGGVVPAEPRRPPDRRRFGQAKETWVALSQLAPDKCPWGSHALPARMSRGCWAVTPKHTELPAPWVQGRGGRPPGRLRGSPRGHCPEALPQRGFGPCGSVVAAVRPRAPPAPGRGALRGSGLPHVFPAEKPHTCVSALRQVGTPGALRPPKFHEGHQAPAGQAGRPPCPC